MGENALKFGLHCILQICTKTVLNSSRRAFPHISQSLTGVAHKLFREYAHKPSVFWMRLCRNQVRSTCRQSGKRKDPLRIKSYRFQVCKVEPLSLIHLFAERVHSYRFHKQSNLIEREKSLFRSAKP